MSKVPENNPSPAAPAPAGLLRQLGVISATALVVSNMVGTGIFTTTGFLAGDLGDPALVLVIWLAGALFALAGAFCYSELGINFPSSGGEYVYLTRAYGPTWGFMTGWVSFFAGFSAPIAAAALAFSDYLGYFFPALRQESAMWTFGSGTFALRVGGAQFVACGLVAVFTVLNFLGVRRVAKVQNTLTAVKLLVIFSFMLLGLAAGTGSIQERWGQAFAEANAGVTDARYPDELQEEVGGIRARLAAASQQSGGQVWDPSSALSDDEASQLAHALVSLYTEIMQYQPSRRG